MKTKNIVTDNKRKLKTMLVGGWPVGYLQNVEELISGPPKTNPSSGRKEDLNLGPPDYKSSALSLGHARLPKKTGLHQTRNYLAQSMISSRE